MEEIRREKSGWDKTVRVMRTVVVVMLVILACAVPAYSWFYMSRRAVAITPVSNPTALYINAANEEDIRYLDLAGIDVTQGTYRDHVFCVRGNNISAYMLQLAYTTNNGFTFELYRAKQGTAPGSAIGSVIYTTHGETTVEQTYYIENAAAKINGHFLNNRTGSDILAKNDDAYHNDTYEGYTNTDNIHENAEPLYWHADSAVIVPDEDKDELNNFCHYFIIRVIWPEGKTNDKETDIIYISARNSTT